MQQTDILIIGAGPIGIELAVLLKRAGADYLHIEAKQIGHTISQWPRQTQFYSAPERVALAGVPVHSPNQQSLTGEMYLAYLRSLVEQQGLKIRSYEPVRTVEQAAAGFIVTTQALAGERQIACQRIVLATGNMSRPRTLGIVGEDATHVHHELDDPHDYFQKRLLIVGGKNSALEAALRCWRAGAEVALSYRQAEFETSIVKPHLAREIKLLIDKGQIDFRPKTLVQHIDGTQVTLCNSDNREETQQLTTDFILFCVGYAMEFDLFDQLGVELAGDERIPQVDKTTMESNVKNVFVCGTAAGGEQAKHELFIVTCHEHAEKIAAALGFPVTQTGSIAARSYSVSFEDVQED